jgi:hypothetical protein
VLAVFYTLLGVSLTVPLVGGLYIRRAGTPEALTAIGCGVLVMLGVQIATAGRGMWGVTPALAGIVAAAIGFTVVLVSRPRTYEPRTV